MNFKKRGYRFLFLLAIIQTMVCSCRSWPNLEVEEKKLLALHKAQQDAHLNKNARQFTDQFAADMISVNRGKISNITNDSAFKRFKDYLDGTVFKKWEDIEPPVISFSDDASMAYMIVNKLVVTTGKETNINGTMDTSRFAWVSIFKKNKNKRWEIVCNISTNE